nr:hypothetical protein [Tanacetum cinerariifolium]
YPDVHSPSQEQSEEVSQAKGELMKSIQTYLETFICIPFEEKPQILFQAWEIFFAIQYSKPENPNKLFQKLLEDLKELAEYENSQSRDHPIFSNNNHSIQNEESFENSSKEIAISSSNLDKEEPPQDSDIHQLIEECSIEVYEEQKQIMEDTMLELVKICQEKEFLCIHDNVDDIIESALNSKLLSINSQHSQKEQQEVKNVVEQLTERRNHSIQSLQNFRVIHKNSISLKNTSQISSIHVVTPILSTKEPEHPLSMGYEHLSITPETESDEVIESNAENLLQIPSACEVTLEDKRDCDVPISTIDICDDHSDIFFDSKIDDDILVYDNDFEDIEYVEASLSDPEIVSIEEENVVHQKEEEIDLEDISQIQDVVLQTRSGNTTHADNSLPEYDSFCFKIEPDQERLINLVKSNISDDSSNDPLLEEADLFLASDNSIPPGIENVADDSEGDVRFLKELLIDDSILSHESPNSNFEDNPSVPLPPQEPPDENFDFEINFGNEISVVRNTIVKFVFDARVKFDVSNENDDLSYFMFVKVFSLLSAESEDTIFDPGIFI